MVNSNSLSMIVFIKSNPKKFILASILLSFITLLIITAEPKGFCSGKAFNGKTGIYVSDDEFIFAALKILSWADTPRGVYKEDGEIVIKPTDEMIKNYMKKHPNCCLVDRKLTGHGINTNQGLLSRALKRKQFVIVAYQDFEGLKNNPIFSGYDNKYLGLDTCGGPHNW